MILHKRQYNKIEFFKVYRNFFLNYFIKDIY